MDNENSGGKNEPKGYDEQYKILLLGESAVGKTCLLLRFVDQMFFENYVGTIGKNKNCFKCVKYSLNLNLRLK